MRRPRRTLAALAVLGLLAAGCTSTAVRDTSTPPTHEVRPAATPTSPRSSATKQPRPRSTTAHATASRGAPRHRMSGAALPLPFRTGAAQQVITAVAASTSSTQGVVQAWRKVTRGWRRVGPAVPAWFGSDGLTRQPSETRSATPIGSFTLTHAFGRLPDPGTALRYFRTRPSDWWISQAGPLYNTHQRCSSGCAFRQGSPNEHLYYETPYYNYAVVIDYNTRNSPTGVVQGKGSAFFLHVTVRAPTQGCISIAQPQLVRLLRWLSPARHPRILIGT